jgi:hypothetical protein
MAEWDSLIPRDPFVGFLYLVILAWAARIIWISMPLWRVYKNLKEQKLLKEARMLEKEANIKGIKKYILFETFGLLLPIIAVLIAKYILDNPQVPIWNPSQVVIALISALLWLAWELRHTYHARQALRPLEKADWIYNDKLRQIKLGLRGIIYTRRGLDSVSNWEEGVTVEELELDLKPVLIDNEEGDGRKLDTVALRENAGQIAEKAMNRLQNIGAAIKDKTSELASEGKEVIDDNLQKNVDNYFAWDRNRILLTTRDIAIVFGPLFIIYAVIPFMG